MGRSVAILFGLPLIIVLVSFLSGCSSGSGVNVVNFVTPANVVLNPATTASIDVGATLTFTATPEDNTKKSLVQPVTYFSDNPAVVTVAANGIACAGTWDSLSLPQVCTPGPAGVAQITASAQGVSSAPTIGSYTARGRCVAPPRIENGTPRTMNGYVRRHVT